MRVRKLYIQCVLIAATGSDEHSTGVYGGGGVMPDDACKTRTYVVNKDDPMYL
jgi:hypothetical protein